MKILWKGSDLHVKRFVNHAIFFGIIFFIFKADLSFGATAQITWSGPNDASVVEIKRRIGGEGAFRFLATVPKNSFDYFDGSLELGQKYEYMLLARDAKSRLVGASYGMARLSEKKQLVRFIEAIDVKDSLKKNNLAVGRGGDHYVIDPRFFYREGEGSVFLFRQGKYRIPNGEKISLSSNSTLVFDDGAEVFVEPSGNASYQIIDLVNVEEIRIFGGLVRGDRYSHLGRDGEWGMGIRVLNSTAVYFEGVVVKECWGDGFYFGVDRVPNRSVWLESIVATENRRNGITVVGGIHLTLSNSTASRNGGVSPGAGVDIEPNRKSDRLENIDIVNLQTQANLGPGLQVGVGKLSSDSSPFAINVFNHEDINSKIGILVSNKTSKGALIFSNGNWRGPGRRVVIRDGATLFRWLSFKGDVFFQGPGLRAYKD